MKTQHRLALTLKTLMAELPLDEISVQLLTKKCKVNRQTFYYYFHDIYDLLAQVFLDEEIEGIEESKNYTELLSKIYEYYVANKAFVDAVLISGGKDLFQEFIYNIFYVISMRFVDRADINKQLTSMEKKDIARFYASAYSQSLIYYLSTYTHKSLKGLLNSFAFVGIENLKKSVQNFIKLKEK